MNVFFKIQVTVLLLVLTKNFSSAYVETNNVINKQPNAAKVLTQFLRVPWINLNSSWADEVTSNCRNDILTLFQSVDVGEEWALQMLDAASKVPAGILTGNIRDLGMYDECINVKSYTNPANIQGKHCTVSFSMPTKHVKDVRRVLDIQKVSIYNPTGDFELSLTTSVCLPATCSIQDIINLTNTSINAVPDVTELDIKVVQVKCSRTERQYELTLGAILTLALFAVVFILLIFSTICDFIRIARSENVPKAIKNIAKFSLYTNAIKLASTKKTPDTLGALHGIRFLNTCMILMGHRIILSLLHPIANSTDILALRQTLLATIAFLLPYVVDTFFILSGFLMSYLFLKMLYSGKRPNIIAVFLHRYVRITPCLVVLILFSTFLLPYLGSGPLWDTIIDTSSSYCKRNWWTNILYIQNYVHKEEMCLLHSWYLAADTHLFIICPFVLYLLFHRPNYGLTVLGMLILVSLVVPASILLINNTVNFINFNKPVFEAYIEIMNSYFVTHNRALPYFMGVFLAYDMLNKKRQVTKLQASLNWTLSTCMVLFCGWAAYYVMPNGIHYDVIWEVIYTSIARLGWSVAMCWILYACIKGYGGAITRFLSLPMFVPLSRLCYCIYLVHFMLQLAHTATARLADYRTPTGVLYLVLGDLAISISIAFIFCLCFESPVIVLEKMIRTGGRSKNSKSASENKQGQLSTMLKEYLNQTNYGVNSDISIETISSQLDFWRKIADKLNTSYDGPKRSPAEWLKVWQDWRSSLSKNENQWEPRIKTIQSGTTQSQTGITVLEKELMTFLTAATCGFENISSFKDPEMTGQRSQLDIRNWRQEEPDQLPMPDSTLANVNKVYSGSVSKEVERNHRKIRSIP